MDNEMQIRIVSKAAAEKIISSDCRNYLGYIENAFKKLANGAALLPDKISQIFDDATQNRINCMPASFIEEKVSGVKWVSVFPHNPFKGRLNVTGQIILSELEYGYPIAFMDGTYITTFRTAGLGAIASKYLAKKNCSCIGFIGSGMQAMMHFKLIKLLHPEIKRCKVSAQADGTTEKFISALANDYPEVEFTDCGSDFKRAIIESDIVITATSSQADILKAEWINKGTLYIHVGGWEDEYAVAHQADKIVCDDWEAVKHRAQTISRMYQAGLLRDDDIYCNIDKIISGCKAGRENDDEFIYFNSVGLGIVDIYIAYMVYNDAIKSDLGETVSL